MKTLLLGIAFAIAGAGCLAFPEPFGPLYLIGLACEAIGLVTCHYWCGKERSY